MSDCTHCGGPLTQAFDVTTAYVRCRRCGHVFPATASEPRLTGTDAWYAGVHLAKRVAAACDTLTLNRVWEAAAKEAHRLPVGHPEAFDPDDTFAWGYTGALGGILDDRMSA